MKPILAAIAAIVCAHNPFAQTIGTKCTAIEAPEVAANTAATAICK